LVLLAITPASASAADRFASPIGTPADDCTDIDPCAIETAVNGSASGDDITLLPGSYTTSTPLLPMGGAFNRTIHGAPGARPTINFTALAGGVTAIQLGPGSTIRDVVLESAAGTGGSGLFVGTDGTIERVSVHETGVDTRACAFNPGTVMRDSVCWYSGTAGSNATALQAQSHFAGGTSTIRNVTAVATNGPGMRVVAAFSASTMALTGTNVITKGAGGPGQEDVNSSITQFGVSATATFDHSNYATEGEGSPTDTITDPGSGTNQMTPPVFVNAAGGDFHQDASSTGTLTKGTATGLVPGELDFEGDPRNQGLAPDIGADEFPAPAAPALTGITPATGSNNNTPTITGTAPLLTTIDLYPNATCTPPAAITGAAAADLLSPGLTVSVPDNSTTTFSATASDAAVSSACSPTTVTYSEVTPVPAAPAVETGQRAAALKKCKKKPKKKRKKCRKKANQLPV